MDEYVVRLAPAPAPGPAATVPVPARPPRRRRRMRGRFRLLLVLGVTYLLVHLVAPGAIPDVAERLVDTVKKPIDSLDGEAQLREATTALNAAWASQGSYALTPSELEAIDADVAWGDLVEMEPCHGGVAAVLVARTVRGSVSRLLVRGDDVGDVDGARTCPSDLRQPHPWGTT